jgi:hypothetical protein
MTDPVDLCFHCLAPAEFVVCIDIPDHPQSQQSCRWHLGRCSAAAVEILENLSMPYAVTVSRKEAPASGRPVA